METSQIRRVKWQFSTFYFFTFFGYGALYPLLAVYLDENIGLAGSQIGMIMSISPIVMIIAQPIWGILSDWTQKPRFLLTITLFLTSMIGVVFSFFSAYVALILLAILLATFQSAAGPLSDSIALNYVQKVKGNYGSLRLWGAIGFAIAVIVAGRISEFTGLTVIFYIFATAIMLSFFFSRGLPEESQSIRVNIRGGMAVLGKKPRFVLFLVTAFLVFGPIYANNTYFGLFIKDIGGTLTGIGIAFLLAAGSEAPFMQFANKFIGKFGMLHVLIMAAVISTLRWFFYFLEPSLYLVYATTIAQGFSVGLFIPAALQYVRDVSPKEVHVTALSIYSAVAGGLGTWFCTYLGGLIFQWYTIQDVYLFYGILSAMGIVTLLVVVRLDYVKRKVKEASV